MVFFLSHLKTRKYRILGHKDHNFMERSLQSSLSNNLRFASITNLLLLKPQIFQTSWTANSASLCENSKWSRIMGQWFAPFLICPLFESSNQIFWWNSSSNPMKLHVMIAQMDSVVSKTPHCAQIMQSVDLICAILTFIEQNEFLPDFHTKSRVWPPVISPDTKGGNVGPLSYTYDEYRVPNFPLSHEVLHKSCQEFCRMEKSTIFVMLSSYIQAD